jgi:hypothetical protein
MTEDHVDLLGVTLSTIRADIRGEVGGERLRKLGRARRGLLCECENVGCWPEQTIPPGDLLVIAINVRGGVGGGQLSKVLTTDPLSQSTSLISIYFDGPMNADSLDGPIKGLVSEDGTQVRW